MANNYCESSSFMDIDPTKIAQAEAIIERITKEMETEDPEKGYEGYCDVNVEVRDDGVWFSHDESINPEHVAIIAREIIEELEIDEPFYCSWAYTCSKPRIDEFGGGAFVIQRGQDTYWVDAMSMVQAHVER